MRAHSPRCVQSIERQEVSLPTAWISSDKKGYTDKNIMSTSTASKKRKDCASTKGGVENKASADAAPTTVWVLLSTVHKKDDYSSEWGGSLGCTADSRVLGVYTSEKLARGAMKAETTRVGWSMVNDHFDNGVEGPYHFDRGLCTTFQIAQRTLSENPICEEKSVCSEELSVYNKSAGEWKSM